MPIAPELLEILACPDCKSKVVLVGERLVCSNAECRKAYRIDDDIPVMLIDEAEPLDETSWQETLKNGQAR